MHELYINVTIEKSRAKVRVPVSLETRPVSWKEMSSSVSTSRNSGVVYLDCNATTPLAPEVLETVTGALRDAWGNPSSGHCAGSTINQISMKIVRHFCSLQELRLVK